MSGWDRARGSARLLCTAALGVILATPALAQATAPPPVQPTPPATDIDPSAPLDPMPDLGVDWPDLKAGDTGLPTIQADGNPAETASTRRYALIVEGLEPVPGAEDLMIAFRKQSALEADRKDPA